MAHRNACFADRSLPHTGPQDQRACTAASAGQVRGAILRRQGDQTRLLLRDDRYGRLRLRAIDVAMRARAYPGPTAKQD